MPLGLWSHLFLNVNIVLNFRFKDVHTNLFECVIIHVFIMFAIYLLKRDNATFIRLYKAERITIQVVFP